MATAGLPASPLSPRWDPALHQPVLSLPQHFGIIALMAYIFVLLVRLPEILAIHFGSSFSVVLGATILAFLSALLSGNIRAVALYRLTLFYLLLHGWFAFTIPFSAWRFGSFSALRVMGQSAGMYVFISLLVRTERHLRLAAWSICASTLGVLVYTTAFSRFDSETYARISTGLGRFGNPNDLALFLMMGIPFWMYVAVSPRYHMVIRFFAGVEIAASVLQCLRTGSRGALLTLILLAVVLFLTVSIANKAKIALLAVSVVFLALTVVPDSVQNRLASVVDSTRDQSAAQSSEGRMSLLVESLNITARHPLFGVGLGVYVDAVRGLSEAAGQFKPSQQVPHNTFTTISAETGVLGLIFYLGCLISAWQAVWRARKMALRIPGLEDLGLLCGCIGLAFLIFTWNNLFFSLTGDVLFYMTCGMCMAAYVVTVERNSAYLASKAATGRTSAPDASAGGVAEEQQQEDSSAPSYPWLEPAATSSLRRSKVGSATTAAAADEPAASPKPGDDSTGQYGDVPWARSPRRRP